MTLCALSFFEQIWIPFAQRCSVLRLVEIGPTVQERKIHKFHQCIFAISLLSPFCKLWFLRRFSNFVNVFLLFRNYLQLEKGKALHLHKLESPSPKDALCQIWLKFAQWFWRRRFLNFVNIFSLFLNYLPSEKAVDLHLNKLDPHHKRLFCAKFGWTLPNSSGEEDENVKI